MQKPTSADSLSIGPPGTFARVRIRDYVLLLLSLCFAGALGLLKAEHVPNVAGRSARVVGFVVAYVVESCVFWIPGYFVYARKGNRRRFVNWCAGATAITAFVAFAGVLRHTVGRTQVPFAQLKRGEIGPDRFFRAARALNPAEFDKGMIGSLEDAYRAASRDMTFSQFRLMSVTDQASSMRVDVSYSGTSIEQGRPPQPLEGFARFFYHRTGVVSLEGLCFASVTDCERLKRLLASAESQLADHMSDSGLGGVVPEEGDCKTETRRLPDGAHDTDVLVCQYGPGIVVTLVRRNQAEVAKAFEDLGAADPVMKRLLGM